VVVRKSKKG